ncbi:MAG: hypothetical protein ACE5OP_09970 [Candidatus Glassbacteria bacterium]
MERKIGFLAILIPLIGSFMIYNADSIRTLEESFMVDYHAALNLNPSTDTPVQRFTPLFSCDVSRDNCGSISPSPASIFIADGALNTLEGTCFFVDVPSYADGVFQVDPSTCSIVSGTYHSVNYGLSQRGIGYDPEHHQFWIGGWNDSYMNQHDADPPYTAISFNYVGIAIAGASVDDSNDYLLVASNSYPDMLYVFDITGGALGTLLGSWSIPWQSSTDGYDMAGCAFDDDSGNLVMVNQYNAGPGIVREEFTFSLAGGLSGAGTCSLDNTNYAWGIALIEDGDPAPGSYYTLNPDIYAFSPPFDVDEYGIPAVYPPYDLTCTVTEDNDIEMNWTNAEVYDAVNIYVDDELFAVLPGDATSYTVESQGPGLRALAVSGVIGEEESGRADCRPIIYPAGEACFYFNETDGFWTWEGYADFEWGYPSYEIDGNAWETNLQGNYFNNACAIFVSPVINLGPEGGWIVFDTYNDVEPYWDGWNVQISFDNGASWEMLYPLEGYDQGVPYGGGG